MIYAIGVDASGSQHGIKIDYTRRMDQIYSAASKMAQAYS